VGKDHTLPDNRPISLLNTISKVAEKAILLRLNKFINAKQTIRLEQFGFRSAHGTVQQVVRVADIITKGFNQNKVTSMLLIDLQKAFDTVWHNGLLFKLQMYKIPFYILQTLQSYLSQRTFYVYNENERSLERKIKAGVPQG
jgi:hypothetical protein